MIEAPYYEEVKNEIGDTYKLVKVAMATKKKLAEKYKIEVGPAVVIRIKENKMP